MARLAIAELPDKSGMRLRMPDLPVQVGVVVLVVVTPQMTDWFVFLNEHEQCKRLIHGERALGDLSAQYQKRCNSIGDQFLWYTESKQQMLLMLIVMDHMISQKGFDPGDELSRFVATVTADPLAFGGESSGVIFGNRGAPPTESVFYREGVPLKGAAKHFKLWNKALSSSVTLYRAEQMCWGIPPA
jgi:hypothetical protein